MYNAGIVRFVLSTRILFLYNEIVSVLFKSMYILNPSDGYFLPLTFTIWSPRVMYPLEFGVVLTEPVYLIELK